MPWVKLDDAMGEHRKVRRLLHSAGIGAFGLHSLGILHASRYLTDGFVEAEYVDETFAITKTRARERDKIITALVDLGLWVPVEGGGWRIHDYLEHNPSKADVDVQRGIDRFRKELTRDHALIGAIRERDGENCRYCGVIVNWKDRRSSIGGTYDHVVPVAQDGENSFENVVVACRGCNGRKGPRTPQQAGMVLLAPRSGPPPGGPSRARSDLARPESDLTPVSSPVPSRPVPSHVVEEEEHWAREPEPAPEAPAAVPTSHPDFDAVMAILVAKLGQRAAMADASIDSALLPYIGKPVNVVRAAADVASAILDQDDKQFEAASLPSRLRGMLRKEAASGDAGPRKGRPPLRVVGTSAHDAEVDAAYDRLQGGAS